MSMKPAGSARLSQSTDMLWQLSISAVHVLRSPTVQAHHWRRGIWNDEMHAISLECTEFYLCQFQKCHGDNDLETWLTPPMLRYFSPSNYSADMLPHNCFNRETQHRIERDVLTRLWQLTHRGRRRRAGDNFFFFAPHTLYYSTIASNERAHSYFDTIIDKDPLEVIVHGSHCESRKALTLCSYRRKHTSCMSGKFMWWIGHETHHPDQGAPDWIGEWIAKCPIDGRTAHTGPVTVLCPYGLLLATRSIVKKTQNTVCALLCSCNLARETAWRQRANAAPLCAGSPGGGGQRCKRGRTCFLFDFAQDVEKSGLHSVTVESVFPATEEVAPSAKNHGHTLFYTKHIAPLIYWTTKLRVNIIFLIF